MVSLLLAIIYLAFISLGLPDPILGAAWPVMSNQLEVDISYMGIITFIISCCTIISSLLSDKLIAKIKIQNVIIISVLLTAIALLGFSFANHFYILCLLAIPYGLGAGAIDSALNNYVALHYSSKDMQWLHCFWGIGTLLSPYIMSYALTLNNNWHLGYRIVFFIQLAIAFILIISLPLWKKKQMQDEKENQPPLVLSFKEKFKIKGAILVFIGFMSYCAFEATIMNWTSTYLVNAKKIDTTTAAAFASLFYIGMTLSRFLLGIFSNKIKDKTLIRIGSVIIAFSIVLILLPFKNNLICLIGFVLIGVGCGPIYPCIVHSTPINFGKQNSQAIIGLQMAFAYLGCTLMPPLFGFLSNITSIKLLPYYILFFFILMSIMLEMLNFKIKKQKN